MFSNYKIPIAFIIFILVIIFGIKIQAQELILFGDDPFDKSFEPVNLDTNVTQTQVTFIGDKNTTKVSKDSGGTRAVAYMRVWGDSSLTITLNMKVWLHGAFNTDSMITQLWRGGNIPLNSGSVFSEATYNYNAVTVASIPDSTVDWVLISIRSTSTNRIYSFPAFLKSNGMIMDVEGNIPITLTGISSGSYYIVIRHRNHLSIMTANAIPLNSNSDLYDFTSDSAKAYGTTPMINLGGGNYGMRSGDANADGNIDSTDSDIWVTQNGTTGYKSADFNLDNSINATDLNNYWLLSNGKSIEIPTSISESWAGIYTDSILGYSYTISRPTDTLVVIYSQSVKWIQKDKDTIWVAAAPDTIIVYPYVAPAPYTENYMITADGDTMFTADGDTMKTLGFIQFDFLQQFNNGEKNETDFISDRSVFAVLSERKRTMDVG